jgi:hypothetical protein
MVTDSVKNREKLRAVVSAFRSRRIRGGGFRSQQRMGFKPECAGSHKRIYSGVPPP